MSISPKLLQKRLSEVRWHLNMSSDVDSNLYAAVDGLADIVGDLVRAMPPAPATEAAPVAPDHGLTGVEQASAVSASGAA